MPAPLPASSYYLEDLHIGFRFSSHTHTLDAAQIKAFAAQFDPQPFHLDENKARNTFFGELVASGWHTAAITMRLLVESPQKIANGLIGAGVNITWPMPTRPGDTLHVESEVIDITPSHSHPERGIVTLHSETLNQHGEVVQNLTSRIVVYRRPSAVSPTDTPSNA